MIVIEKLIASDLLCLRGKKVVLYGGSKEIKIASSILMALGTPNVFVVSSDKYSCKVQKNAINFASTKIWRQDKVFSSDVTVLVCAASIKHSLNISEDIFADFDLEILNRSFSPLLFIEKIKSPFSYTVYKTIWEINRRRSFNIESLASRIKRLRSPLFVCLPMKTADHSLYNTFDCINNTDIDYITEIRFKNNLKHKLFKIIYYLKDILFCSKKVIEYVNVVHKPRVINKTRFKKYTAVKIITAIRDPIGQNLSALYQELPSLDTIDDWIFGECINKSKVERIKYLSKIEQDIKMKNNDVQYWFDCYIDRYVYPTGLLAKYSTHSKAIQTFIPDFQRNVIDILSYPFDKEKGFTIIKEKNVEIFVYQLEKLNSVVPELSAWIGVSFDKFVNGNVTDEKWSGSSYKRACEDILITKEYLEKCYAESYVKHCYSEEDIQRLKTKWGAHVTN